MFYDIHSFRAGATTWLDSASADSPIDALRKAVDKYPGSYANGSSYLVMPVNSVGGTINAKGAQCLFRLEIQPPVPAQTVIVAATS